MPANQSISAIRLNRWEKEALALISRERSAWEHSDVWVSDSAYFNMRSEIDAARKNYFGQYEDSIDDTSDLSKIWIPLTEWTVERMVANIDLDTKDIHLRHPEGKDSKGALLMKLILANFLKKINFGEFLNDFLRRLAIDGTAIAKCYLAYNEEFKRNLPVVKVVDTLNVIVDPAAYSLQEVPIIEKAVMTIDEIERYRGKWKNLDYIDYSQGSVPQTTIYERWGKIPLAFVTNKKSDAGKWVEGHLIASGGAPQKRATSHLAEQTYIPHYAEVNKKNIKPYEECWLKRVPGRFHGRGIPEQISGLQEWINAIVNIRREDLLNKLAGKYKVRKGSGLRRSDFEAIRAGGVLLVDNMDDIQELRESDVKPSAYREPLEMTGMAEKVTGAMEVPSTPGMQATTAIVQERGARSISNLIQENVGLFLERLIKRHLVPLVLESLKNGEILRITGEKEDLAIIDDAYTNYVLSTKGENLSPLGKRRLIGRVRRQLEKWGNDRPLKVLKEVFSTDYDVDVSVTAERLDTALILRNLNDFLLTYGRLPQADLGVINSVVKEYLQTLELPISRFMPNRQAVPVTPPSPASPEPRKSLATPMGEFQRASVEGTLSANKRVTSK